MPIYCYTTENGETFEFSFPMNSIPETVTLEDGQKAFRDIVAEHRGFRNTPGNWPQESMFCGVHPKQIPELRAHLKKHGLNTTITRHGDPVFQTRGERARYLRAVGYYDRSAGYSDPSPQYYTGD